MAYVICPQCGLNYMNDTDEVCTVCKSQQSGSVSKRIRSATVRTPRPIKRQNIAFKCTYCDGGKSDAAVGFNGLCSDEQRKRNIREKHVWCNAKESLCRQYNDGAISREDYEGRYTADKKCVCYESHLFDDWTFSAGLVVRGRNKGKPNTIRGVQTDCLSVLTTEKPGASDTQKAVVGVFIVRRADEGDEKNAGIVFAHEKYRLTLTEEQSEKINFWNYHNNAADKRQNFWGTGLFRYMSNAECVKLLSDIVEVKKGAADHGLAQEMLDYYRQKNDI